jgi:putative transposase
VTRHWSGKHHTVVQGINLESLVWSHGDKIVPIDCRLYAKAEDQQTKNDHARTMFSIAKEHGFEPDLVMFDSWYASLANLKHLRAQQWHWLCRLKSNHLVDPDNTVNCAITKLDIPATGLQVHLKGYGFIKVFRTVTPHGDAQHWATSQLGMTLEQLQSYSQQAWSIETYHRAIKQTVGIEKAQVPLAIRQRNHILLALRAFLRLEWNPIAYKRASLGIRLSSISCGTLFMTISFSLPLRWQLRNSYNYKNIEFLTLRPSSRTCLFRNLRR